MLKVFVCDSILSVTERLTERMLNTDVGIESIFINLFALSLNCVFLAVKTSLQKTY